MDRLKRAVEDIDSRYAGNCLVLNIRVFLFLGGWPLQPDERYIILKLLRILKYLLFFAGTVSTVVFTCGIVARWGDMERVGESIVVLIVVETAMIKTYLVLFKIRGFLELVDILEKLANKCLVDDNERRIFYRFKRAGEFLTLWYGAFCVLAGVSYGIMPLFREGRRLPADFWCAFECTGTPIFEILYMLSWGVCIGLGIINGLVDTFCMSLLIYAIGQFRILQYRLGHSMQYALKKVALNKALRKTIVNLNMHSPHNFQTPFKEIPIDVSTVSSGRNNPQNQSVNSLNHPGLNMLKASRRFVLRGKKKGELPKLENLSLNARERDEQRENTPTSRFHELSQEVHLHLIDCIKSHQTLFRFAELLQDQFGVMFFSELTFASMIICVLLFLLATYKSDIGKIIEWGGILIVAVVQLFAFCWFSSELTHQSTLLGDALYCSDWTRAPPEFKKMMRTIMCRSLQPVQLTAGGFMPFSVEQFQAVMNSAYSCFATLTEFNAKLRGSVTLSTNQ